jgi:hypothetical protein
VGVSEEEEVGVRWLPVWDLVGRQSLASKGMKTEVEGYTALEAVTR